MMGVSNRPTEQSGRGRDTVARWLVGLASLISVIPLAAQGEEPKPRALVGAYYFDGWSGQTNHITELLKTEFADRQPVWGWKDDTVEIMQRQIDYCADHGSPSGPSAGTTRRARTKPRLSTTPSTCISNPPTASD